MESSKFTRQTFSSKKLGGFTILEVLLVVGLIAILGVATLVFLNPVENLRRTRDTKRLVDLQSIHRALNLYRTDLKTKFGSPNIVYISLPDNDDTLPAECDEYSLPPLPSGWSYACALKSNFRKIDSTGWIPVNFQAISFGSPIPALPIDPINSSTGGLYYTYVTGGSWKLTALIESQRYIGTAAKDGGASDAAFEVGTNLNLAVGIFPNGWVRTPQGLLVMKYEAKYDKDGDADGDSASGANCLADSGDGLDWRDIGCNTASNIVSTANGSPIVHISHTQAKAACEAIGARLINNAEWMTIARDVEQVAQNWSSGIVGTGCLFRGNVGANTCGYNGADPERGTGRNSKAKLILSNSAEIWDVAGNVWEHVMKDSADTLIQNHPTDGGAAGWRWIEHTAITGYGDLSYNEIRPSNNTWNATQGMGGVYSYNGSEASPIRVLLRGGSWNDGAGGRSFLVVLGLGRGRSGRRCGVSLRPVGLSVAI